MLNVSYQVILLRVILSMVNAQKILLHYGPDSRTERKHSKNSCIIIQFLTSSGVNERCEQVAQYSLAYARILDHSILAVFCFSSHDCL